MPTQQLSQSIELSPGEPLWKRAPGRDAEGRALSDFMMLIPRLRTKPHHVIEATIGEIQRVLSAYEKIVVFADLNLKINVLWVTVRPVPGICLELPAAIKTRVPEALLVGQKLDPGA